MKDRLFRKEREQEKIDLCKREDMFIREKKEGPSCSSSSDQWLYKISFCAQI